MNNVSRIPCVPKGVFFSVWGSVRNPWLTLETDITKWDLFYDSKASMVCECALQGIEIANCWLQSWETFFFFFFKVTFY